MRRFLLPLALLLSPAPAQAAPSPSLSAAQIAAQAGGAQVGGGNGEAVKAMTGVTLKAPSGLTQKTGFYYPVVCAWTCQVYGKTTAGGFLDSKEATLVVHLPFPAPAGALLDARLTLLAQETKVVSKTQRAGETRPDGTRLLLQRLVTSDAQGRETLRVLSAVERGGVSVLAELIAPDEASLNRQATTYAALIESLRVDAGAVRAREQARVQAVKEAGAAIAGAYAKGEKVRIYSRPQVHPGWIGPTVFGPKIYPQVLILLPGGVALLEMDEDGLERALPPVNLRSPDLVALFGSAAPTRWTQKGNTVTLKEARGGTTVLTRSADGQRLVPPPVPNADGYADSDWRQVPPQSAASLAGSYSYSSIVSAAGTGGSFGLPAVFASSGGDLTLNTDGTYRRSTESAVGVSGSVSGADTRSRGAGGRWTFDPASFTLTFTPQEGAAYSVLAFGRSAEECKVLAECTWRIGNSDWRKR